MSKTKSPVKRIVITIFLCIIVMAITKTFVYINIAYPNMEDSLFVPITVKDVPDSEDIVVDMNIIGPKPKNRELPMQIHINELNHGWLCYDKWGKCRIIFESDKSFDGFAYVDDVPRSRISLDDKLDEFSVIFRAQQHQSTSYYSDSIRSGIYQYPAITRVTRQGILVSAVFIAGAVVVNILISKKKE
ncbi:MAG: hypothetical protein K6F49_12070 [Saccharofermentans sp.]|nr:hypothetical protein [Saccharofermentans sp.]